MRYQRRKSAATKIFTLADDYLPNLISLYEGFKLLLINLLEQIGGGGSHVE